MLSEQLEKLWQLAQSKLKSLPDQPEHTLPASVMLWLLGFYQQVWGNLKGWEHWLRKFYAPAQVLESASLIPLTPGWKPNTRRALLSFVIGFLEPAPEPETHLEILGELVEVASKLKCQTQAELLLAEMPLLLGQIEAEHTRNAAHEILAPLAFKLGMQWLRHGLAREARFAVKSWQSSFKALTPDDQLWEIKSMLSGLSWYWFDAHPRQLPLDAFSLLQSWLKQIRLWLQHDCPASEREALLLELLRIARKWQLPEMQELEMALGIASMSPVCKAAVIKYADRLWGPEALDTARTYASALPSWLAGKQSAQAFDQAYSLEISDQLNPELQAISLELQTAALLLQQEPLKVPKRGQKKRQRLLNWGSSLIEPLSQQILNQSRQLIQAGLATAQEQLASSQTNSQVEAAEALTAELNALQSLALQRQHAIELLEYAPRPLENWIQAVLSLPSEELNPEQIEQLADLVLAAESVNPCQSWDLNLALAEGLLRHRPWSEVRPYWLKLFEHWQQLEEIEQLRKIAALGLRLASLELPERAGWFKRLKELAFKVDVQWQGSALAAVGHCQIRAAELQAGLETLEQITNPEERLQALLQISSVLKEIKDSRFYPEVMMAILLCAKAQKQSQPAWSGHLAVALAYWVRGEQAESLEIFRQGLAYLA